MGAIIKTIYEEIIEAGFSRRQFLDMCSAAAAMIHLEHSGTEQVVRALEQKEKVPVIWLHFQDCTGCSESFIRSSYPRASDLILDYISLNYHETLTAAAGEATELARKQTMEKYKGKYILAVEGSIPQDEFFFSGGRSAAEQVREAAEHAAAILAIGSCSSYGGIAAANPNPTGARSLQEVLPDKTIINVPGCPPIPEVLTGIIAHCAIFGEPPELDRRGRPKCFYSKSVHSTCNRLDAFKAGLFVESFDDEGAKKGYCLYKVGCRGITTFNACSQACWNDGLSFPIQSGNTCLGCSEENFWDTGSFYAPMKKKAKPAAAAGAK